MPTPIAAAIGMGLTSSGRSEITVIADIGADLTDVGVISFGGLVSSHTAPIGGSALDRAIVALVRREHGVVLSPSAAEAAKLEVGAVPPLGRHPVRQTVVNGRDITTGMPRGLVLTTVDVGRAIAGPVARIVDAIRAGLAGLLARDLRRPARRRRHPHRRLRPAARAGAADPRPDRAGRAARGRHRRRGRARRRGGAALGPLAGAVRPRGLPAPASADGRAGVLTPGSFPLREVHRRVTMGAWPSKGCRDTT
ncbi:rod shape-determining protein [Actinomadura madurae]|nr:rod shape-determining protein [Actinomadura madurae]MCQ0010686.1 rod shape-determining protein [Actinomadura madurae]